FRSGSAESKIAGEQVEVAQVDRPVVVEVTVGPELPGLPAVAGELVEVTEVGRAVERRVALTRETREYGRAIYRAEKARDAAQRTRLGVADCERVAGGVGAGQSVPGPGIGAAAVVGRDNQGAN